ncbi:MAG: S8 family peptidase [Pseudomonadota bacterium]
MTKDLPRLLALCALFVIPWSQAAVSQRTLVIASGMDANGDRLDDQVWLQTAAGDIRAPLLNTIPGAYATAVADSRWIGPTATAGQSSASHTTSRFKTSFMLPEGFSAPYLNICLHADNYASVALNGVGFGQQIKADVIANFQAPAECMAVTAGFRAGVNEVAIDLYNSGGPAGLNFSLTLSYSSDWEAPFLESSPKAIVVPNEYLVAFKDEVPDVAGYAARISAANDLTIVEVFDSKYGIKGFSTQSSSIKLAKIQMDPAVESVESDEVLSTSTVQDFAGHGLDRLDQKNLPLNSKYTYTSTGKGVNVYIVDSGIDIAHPEFEGRASLGADFIGSGAWDCFGHGTSVAGAVGGKTYGVAKGANLISVRVTNCKGAGAARLFLKGINWLTDNAVPNSVVNVSMGGPAKKIYNQITSIGEKAILKSIKEKNLVYVVAAGNENEDACKTTPARIPEVLTVGAAQILIPGNSAVVAADGTVTSPVGPIVDGLMYLQSDAGTNVGSCVDLFAVGRGIQTAKMGGGSRFVDGTSIAAPMASGVAARYRQNHSIGDIGYIIKANASPGVFADSKGSPNLMLYSGFLDDPVRTTVTLSGENAPQGPVVRIEARVNPAGSYYYKWVEERCITAGNTESCSTLATPAVLNKTFYEIRADSGWSYSILRVSVVEGSGTEVANESRYVRNQLRQ